MMDFRAFFSAVHGYAPFPWQDEMSRRLLCGEEVDYIRVPTAAGKSAVVDAAVFAAINGGRRRICFVVDRRIVVDEVHERAERIARVLEKDPALHELKAKAGEIQIVRLRGGVHGDDDWVLYPERLTILVSTVDQIGSRLLFRGYGVSSRMAPVHSGFLGNDLLLIVDEAHLSQPFIETMEAIQHYGADLRMMVMTATPPVAPKHPVDLSPTDRANPVLARRLQARKLATLKLVSESGERAFAKAAMAEAMRLSEQAGVVGIVVNRVGTARLIFDLLRSSGETAVLLIGRNRAVSRDALLAEWLPKIQVGRERTTATTLFVVATQTIEVGANVDFDALVTESAPLSSLRQRFGRLDRIGELGESNAVIIHRPPRSKDTVYGDFLLPTWDWLTRNAINAAVDFGIESMERLLETQPPPAEELRHAPLLLPNHLFALQQTGPLSPAFNVAPYLHGPAQTSAEVTVVWRADLDLVPQDTWIETVACRPPLAAETIELPLPALRAWLLGESNIEVSDLVVQGTGDAVTDSRTVVRWRGSDQVDVVSAGALRPGDTVVVPASYGGCDDFGWNPHMKDPVDDLADNCSAQLERGHMVRINGATMRWCHHHHAELVNTAAAYLDVLKNIDPESGVDLNALAFEETRLRTLVTQIGGPLLTALGTQYFIEPYPAGLLLRRNRLEDIGGTLTGGKPIPLNEHQAGVARWCALFALNNPQSEQLIRAAATHDEGKKEGRFQIMLHGSPLQAAVGPILAKSGLRGPEKLRLSWRHSGLPQGFRHELASLACSNEQEPLVRHLIGTHHGFGRPWYPRCSEALALGAELGHIASGWGEQFFGLSKSFGPWKLAGQEALLRAADARRSMEEQSDA